MVTFALNNNPEGHLLRLVPREDNGFWEILICCGPWDDKKGHHAFSNLKTKEPILAGRPDLWRFAKEIRKIIKGKNTEEQKLNLTFEKNQPQFMVQMKFIDEEADKYKFLEKHKGKFAFTPGVNLRFSILQSGRKDDQYLYEHGGQHSGLVQYYSAAELLKFAEDLEREAGPIEEKGRGGISMFTKIRLKKRLKNCSHYRLEDDGRLYYKNKRMDVDLNSFRTLNDVFAVDTKHVYIYGEEAGKEFDPKSFEFYDYRCPMDEYARDKNHVYREYDIILGADPSTFQYVGGHYTKDKSYVYHDGEVVIGADPKSFQFLADFYAKDGKHAYFYGHQIPDANPSTFRYLKDGCATDKNNVFKGSRKIPLHN